MSSSIFWLVSACLLGALVLQGLLLRVRHRRHLEALRTQHQQARVKLSEDLEQMTLRLAQIQREQKPASPPAVRNDAAARQAARQAIVDRQALERELDDADRLRGARPTDGFADTEVLAHESQEESLLLP